MKATLTIIVMCLSLTSLFCQTSHINEVDNFLNDVFFSDTNLSVSKCSENYGHYLSKHPKPPIDTSNIRIVGNNTLHHFDFGRLVIEPADLDMEIFKHRTEKEIIRHEFELKIRNVGGNTDSLLILFENLDMDWAASLYINTKAQYQFKTRQYNTNPISRETIDSVMALGGSLDYRMDNYEKLLYENTWGVYRKEFGLENVYYTIPIFTETYHYAYFEWFYVCGSECAEGFAGIYMKSKEKWTPILVTIIWTS